MRRTDELIAWMSERGGVAHSADLVAAGFTVHGIRVAITTAGCSRLRRSWLVAPGADAALVAAAEIGGRLTCVSAARRLGWWTRGDEHAHHIVVAPSAARIETAAVVHWARGPAPFARHGLVDPAFNVLFQVARCAPPADAAAVWESALRRGDVDPAVLARVAWRSQAAAKLAATASLLSDSGIETAFVALMRGIGVAVAQQVVIDGHRVDGLIGARLIVELDGFAHHQARDRRRDLRTDARLALRGFTVLRFDYQQVLFDAAYVVDTVVTAIAQGKHR